MDVRFLEIEYENDNSLLFPALIFGDAKGSWTIDWTWIYARFVSMLLISRETLARPSLHLHGSSFGIRMALNSDKLEITEETRLIGANAKCISDCYDDYVAKLRGNGALCFWRICKIV